MLREFARKYKWHLLGVVVVYVGVSLWLFFLTNTPQSVPFEYQLR